jgi:hypothetical protein
MCFCFFFLSFSFLLVGLGFELRALHLQSRCSTAWATPPVHFALVILEMGVPWTICPGWPWTVILPISTSQVARITGVSHCHSVWLHVLTYVHTYSNMLLVKLLCSGYKSKHFTCVFLFHPQNYPLRLILFISFFLSITGAWTQGFHLEPLQKRPVFVKVVFEIGSHKLFAWAGFKPQSSWSLPPECEPLHLAFISILLIGMLRPYKIK